MVEEGWRPISGYVGYYEVSNTGKIRTLRHYDKSGHPMELKTSTSRSGYQQVVLCVNYKCETKPIHRAVAEEFLENKSMTNEVSHKDHNKDNNNMNNLEWCSHAKNVLGTVRDKRHVFGERVVQSKLKKGEVLLIRKIAASMVLPYIGIAKMFKIRQNHVGRIVRKEAWRIV